MEDGVYPLGLATFRGRLDLVRLLLRHDAIVDTHGPDGPTALHTACVGDHFTIVQKLLAAGADPNERDEQDHGPLHWLARRGSVQILKYLIQAGSKMDAKDRDGYAPIHYAADAGNLPILHELVRAGSSHAWLSNSRQTPLAVASMTGDPGSGRSRRRGFYPPRDCRPARALRGGADAAEVRRQQARTQRLPRRSQRRGHGRERQDDPGVGPRGGGRSRQGRLNKHKDDPAALHGGLLPPARHVHTLEAGGDENAADNMAKTPVDVVDTMRSERVRHGLGRRRVRRMLAQGPAYRARSWKWPNTSTSSSLLLTAKPANDEAESTKNAAEPMAGEAGTGAAEEGATEPAEMTTEDFDLAFEAAMAITAESAGAGKVYRRPATSSSGAAVGRSSAVVASLIRYSEKK
ncbi:unnamed protein product [Laminaria digitata]